MQKLEDFSQYIFQQIQGQSVLSYKSASCSLFFRIDFSLFIYCNLHSFVDVLSCFDMKGSFKWFCETFHCVLEKTANTDDGQSRFKFELRGRTKHSLDRELQAFTNSLLANSKSEEPRGTSYMCLVNNWYYCRNLFKINLHKTHRSIQWLPEFAESIGERRLMAIRFWL